MDIVNALTDASINRIDRNYAVFHIPVAKMTPNSIYDFNYSSIPSCFGLMSNSDILSYSSLGSLQIDSSVDNTSNKLRGQGVLVGFVDTGIDYMNSVFKYADNTSRVVSIWDQTIESENNFPEDFNYGTEFSQEQINLALQNENPLSVPSTDDIGHGTMLAGIAAGFQVEEGGYMGIAPDANFVIVKLKPAKPYLKDFAICIGVGTSQGSHGGRSKLSTYLALAGGKVGTAIIVAAGNEGNVDIIIMVR